MLNKMLIIAAVAYLIALIGTVVAPRAERRDTPRAPHPTVASEDSERPLVARPLHYGFTLNFHHPDQLQLYLDAIDQLAAMGFNSVLINTPIYQVDGAAEQITRVERVGFSPTREQLVTLLKHARSAKLHTTLMPMVLFTSPRDGEWRGKLRPPYWAPWWQSYRAQIDYFIDIANETGVDTFCVGSELVSTETQTDRWLDLIAHVRSRYQGRLIYSANWDRYQQVQFWYALDAIGVNGYWRLTERTHPERPSQQELEDRWRQLRRQLLMYAANEKRPVLLTEVGYPSLPWGLRDPWNYVAPEGTEATHSQQLAGYQAFIAAWRNQLGLQNDPNVFAGVYFYKWEVYRKSTRFDTSYGVLGKPTERLLLDWLRTRTAPPAPSRTTDGPGA